jgi:hypothetical protein
MALIITAVNDHVAIQVADTLLSLNGKPYDDKLVKTAIVHSSTGKLALSYTGVGRLDGVRTDLWIAREFQAFKTWTRPAPDILEFLKSNLTEAAPRNSYLTAKGLGLTVVLSGFVTMRDGHLGPAIAEVTNQHRPHPKSMTSESFAVPQSSFLVHKMNLGKDSSYISISGALDPFAGNSFRRKIEKLLREAVDTETQMGVVRLMVGMLRQHRLGRGLAGVIGERCTSAIIQKDLRSASSYFGKHGVAIYRIPNIVACTGARTDQVFPATPKAKHEL